jgi:hypothetical protein
MTLIKSEGGFMKITVYNPSKFGDTKKVMNIKEYRKYFEEERNKEIKEKVFKSLKKNFSKLECDGHGIYFAKHYLVDLELPEDIVLPMITKHKSIYSEGHTGIIYGDNGHIIDYMYGINNLSMLYCLCDLLEANDYDSKHGRGSQAAQLYSALKRKLNIKSE